MSRARRVTAVAGAVALSSVVGLTAVGGQEGGSAQPATPPGQQTAQLTYEREVFVYPTFERRNPFRELVGEGSGPRFESMRLQGVIYSSIDPSQSMVLLSAGVGERARTEHLRVGQSWGNVRVLEIRQNEIVVEVEEFGLTEQRIMQLPTRGQGGS